MVKSWTVKSAEELEMVAGEVATSLVWPFCLELVGDVGAGKTTFVKGLARGLGSLDDVTSPSFTINNQYRLSDGRILSHFDFYRLSEGGVMNQELAEDLNDVQTSVVVEWGETIGAVLPSQRYRLVIDYTADGREVTLGELKA